MYKPNPLDRVAIFIDGENIHYSAKHLNMRLDYLKLCQELTGGRRLLRAYFYTVLSGQSEGKIDFINFLRLNGFKVVTKELRPYQEGEVPPRAYRGNLNLEMAIHVLELLPQLDTVIICSGDGDFAPLVDAVARKGRHVEVCGLREMTSTDLIAAADGYTDLALLKERVTLQREAKSEAAPSVDYNAIDY